jgi:RNA polymerase sigma factor (sigma-70 family)
MSDDRQLLRRFATDRSETAFGELVTRHVTLVYSAALRQTGGDAHRAQDIAQLVFTDLARKAPALSENVVLAGWLHRATIFAARQILRGERRRRAREQEAVTMNAIQSETGNENWQQICPLLDKALERLNKTDRDALLLRFFEQQSLAQVGATLGGSEDAARKRINRALEKLRAILTRNGVTTTAAALSTVISANAIQVAPAGLAATLTNASLAAAGTGTAFTLLKIMTMTKLKLGISALVIAGATTAFVVQYQTQIKLREENESLRQQMTQQISQLESENENLSNRLVAVGDSKKLSDEQFIELLRLRGEFGVLRQQTNEIGRLREENRQLHAQFITAQNQSVRLPTKAEYEWYKTNTINTMKWLGLDMKEYAADHNDNYATNFNQLEEVVHSFTNYPIGTNSVEFVNAGLVSGDYPRMIMFRELTPRKTPNGKWERIYGFADGSVWTETSEDGNFDAFERQHTVSPSANDQ